MEITEIYSKAGKKIPLKNGVIVYSGSFVRSRDNDFVPVTTKSLIKITRGDYNDISQSRCDNQIELIPIS